MPGLSLRSARSAVGRAIEECQPEAPRQMRSLMLLEVVQVEARGIAAVEGRQEFEQAPPRPRGRRTVKNRKDVVQLGRDRMPSRRSGFFTFGSRVVPLLWRRRAKSNLAVSPSTPCSAASRSSRCVGQNREVCPLPPPLGQPPWRRWRSFRASSACIAQRKVRPWTTSPVKLFMSRVREVGSGGLPDQAVRALPTMAPTAWPS